MGQFQGKEIGPGWPDLASHRFLTDWLDGTGPRMPASDTRWTLTCGYGFRRTDRTRGTDLRNRWKRLFVSYHCCWAELDSRADLAFVFVICLQALKVSYKRSVNQRDKKGKVSRMRCIAVSLGASSSAAGRRGQRPGGQARVQPDLAQALGELLPGALDA